MSSRQGRALGLRATIGWGLLVVLAAIPLTAIVAESTSDRFGGDVRNHYYPAAEAVLDGRPLYVSPDAPGVEQAIRDQDVVAYVYPPVVAVAFAPFTVLPIDAAVVGVLAASMACLLGALWLSGLTDGRCYLLVFAWPGLWNTLETLNITAMLVLAVAVAWRVRSTTWPLASTTGLAIAAKIFLWPLVVWSLAMRRFTQAALGVGVATLVTLGSWALVGFQGLTEYPRLARVLSDALADESYSVSGMTSALGADPLLGTLTMLAVGGTLLAACWHFCRTGDEARGFTAALLAALALTPIAWQHYVLLLVVPLALLRPRLSALWFVPLLAWVSPRVGNGDGLEPFVPAVAVLLIGICLLAWRQPAPRSVPA